MTAANDDQLAGIDLGAWAPPPTTPAQIDDVVERLKIDRDGTRADAATPLADDPVPRSAKVKWMASGIAIGAAAAAIVAVALWPAGDGGSSSDRVVDPGRLLSTWPAARHDGFRKLTAPERIAVLGRIEAAHQIRAGGGGGATALVARGDAATPDEVERAATELAPLLGECYEIAGVAITGERKLAADVELFGDPAVGSVVVDVALSGDDVATSPALAECVRETLMSIELAGVDKTMRTTLSFAIHPDPAALLYDDVAKALAADDFDAAYELAAKLTPDSKYFEPANKRIDDAISDRAIELATAAKDLPSRACERQLDDARKLAHRSKRGKALLDGFACADMDTFDFATPMSTSCKPGDGDRLMDEARAAGRVQDWSVMRDKAEAAAKCGVGKTARQLRLMAACKMGDTKLAKMLYKEFERSSSMQTVCIDVVSDANEPGPTRPRPGDAKCADGEGDKLIAESRNAGQVNRWVTMLQKAEAAARCGIGKTARQLQLMAACKMGNKDKAKKLYPEFSQNTSMQTVCLGVVD